MVPLNQDFLDLRTKAELLELCDDPEGAKQLRERSLEVAREVDMVCYGYLLLWRNRAADAIDLLERNAARNPDSWNAWDSLGDAYADHGDIRRAADCYGNASQLVKNEEERLRIERSLREMIALGTLAS
ncbi:MAG: hypothetical protein ACXW2P_03495 [Thermoanaerobaculia bacterium]